MTERLAQRMGNYLLRRLIGIGAFADVYLATHIYLNSHVAIKVLHTHVNAHTWEGFLTEARHLNHLEHPHIIRILDFGIEDEDPFLVMDYASGGNLRQRHPAGSVVALLTVLSYVATIASALQYTHDQHLIHRDLKPENLLVGSQGEILLSDFSLALLTAGTGELQVQERFGTLAYMSPEQIHGLASPASDQYALAVMVYEWLCGRRPFEGTVEQLASHHLYSTPASLREQRPEIPPAVELVVFKALSKDSSMRFPDVLSFATAIEEASHLATPSLNLSNPATEEVIEAEQARTILSGSHTYVQNLPVPLTSLIGRERELQLALTRLLRPEVRLLTLIGTPGVGKTHLALTLGAEMQGIFAQGICFVSLANIYDPDQVVPAILHALGRPESKDRTPFAHLVAYLHEKQFLLLLDTFEHLLLAAPLLTELLSVCPQLKIMVTSRAALHVQGEYELVVPPLALPNLRALPSLDTLAQVPAVALFVERVEALKPGFALTNQNAPLISELCVRLGGVPLAIELAAARCKLLSLEALLARLKQGLEVLTGGKQNVPSRQQTLRNTIVWSHALLSSEEQVFFRRLCIFVGEFTMEAAEEVATTQAESSLSALDGVISLVDKSLLLQREEENHEPRLYLLEYIRAFGLEQLAERGELEDCQQAHATYYLTLAEQFEGDLRSAGQIAWFGQVEMEYENIRAALQWFLEHHELEAALRLPIALRQFWFLHGRLSEGYAFLEQALAASLRDKRLQVSSLRARGFYVAGYLASRQQDFVLAASHLTAGLELFRHLQDKGGIAACLSRLGFIQYIRGEVAQGKAKIAESLSLSQEIGDRRISAEVWHSLGTGALYQGRYSEARKQLEQGLALFEAEDDVWGKANELHQLGVTLFAQKDYARARQFSEESLALLRTMGSPYSTSETLTVLACTLAALGELSRAQGLLEEALTQASTRESTEDLVRVLCGVAYVKLQQGNLAAARASLEEGLTKMQGRWFDPRSKWGLAGCLECLGELSLAQSHAAWAVQLWAAAETIRGADGYYSPLGRKQASHERALAEARRQLGEKTFAAAWAEGQTLTPQQVIAAITPGLALEKVHPAAQTNRRVIAISTLPGGLTAREIEVLCLLAQGLSNHQIAEQLVLSPYTVNSHTQSIYGKLGINTRSAATRFAVDHHLL